MIPSSPVLRGTAMCWWQGEETCCPSCPFIIRGVKLAEGQHTLCLALPVTACCSHQQLQGLFSAHRFCSSAPHQVGICFACSQHPSAKLLTPKCSLSQVISRLKFLCFMWRFSEAIRSAGAREHRQDWEKQDHHLLLAYVSLLHRGQDKCC